MENHRKPFNKWGISLKLTIGDIQNILFDKFLYFTSFQLYSHLVADHIDMYTQSYMHTHIHNQMYMSLCIWSVLNIL